MIKSTMATSFQGYIEGTGGREPQEESIVEEGIEDPRLRKVGIVVEKLVRFLAKHVDHSLEEIVGLFGTDGLNLVEILKEIDRELEEFEEIRAPQLLTQERIHKVIFIKGVPNALWRLDAGVYGYLKQKIESNSRKFLGCSKAVLIPPLGKKHICMSEEWLNILAPIKMRSISKKE